MVTLRPALPATGLPILTPAGLPPAEHISLSWTHNRTGCFHSIRLSSPRLRRTGRRSASRRARAWFSIRMPLLVWSPGTCPPWPCPGHYPRRWATTGTLSPWALLPVGDPVVVCQVRSTFRASVRPLPLLIAGCVLPEDHPGDAQTPVRQESGFQRLSRR